jgi:antitoxin PrlF
MPRMTTKGQVTIPKRVREHLGLKPGSEVEFAVTKDGQIAIKTKEKKPKGRFEEFVGTIDLGMTTDEYMKLMRGEPEK